MKFQASTLKAGVFCKKPHPFWSSIASRALCRKKNAYRGSPPCTIFLTSSEQRNIVQLCTIRDPAVFNLVLDFYRTGRLHTRKEVQFQWWWRGNVSFIEMVMMTAAKEYCRLIGNQMCVIIYNIVLYIKLIIATIVNSWPGLCHGLCRRVGLLASQRAEHGGEAVSRDVLQHNDGHGGAVASTMIMFKVDLLIFFEKKS